MILNFESKQGLNIDFITKTEQCKSYKENYLT